jgi:hypothetical protein
MSGQEGEMALRVARFVVLLCCVTLLRVETASANSNPACNLNRSLYALQVLNQALQSTSSEAHARSIISDMQMELVRLKVDGFEWHTVNRAGTTYKERFGSTVDHQKRLVETFFNDGLGAAQDMIRRDDQRRSGRLLAKTIEAHNCPSTDVAARLQDIDGLADNDQLISVLTVLRPGSSLKTPLKHLKGDLEETLLYDNWILASTLGLFGLFTALLVILNLIDKRKHRRHNASIDGTLDVGSISYKVQIRDISKGGARISPLLRVKEGDAVYLQFLGHSMWAEVRWTGKSGFGIKFDKELERVPAKRSLVNISLSKDVPQPSAAKG